MGCCKNRSRSVEKIKDALQKNTLEFTEYKNIKTFRDRAERSKLRNGVCLNIVMIEGRIFCPLHPMRNSGQDLRIGYCLENFFCRTAILFNQWDEIKQNDFLNFVSGQKLDAVTYSINIYDGNLLRNFRKTLSI